MGCSGALRRIANPDRIGEWQSRGGRIARDAERQGAPEPRSQGLVGRAASSQGLRSARRTGVASERTFGSRGSTPEPNFSVEVIGNAERLPNGRQPTESARPGLARRRNEPPIPEGVDSRSLHVAVRAELRSLPKDLAEIVAAHLVVAGQLIDDDPELAYAHAEAARRRAARLPIVREAAAETAYAAGRYDVALSEFRALRRMTGTPDYLPVMADCERALGRPHNAIKLAREADRAGLDPGAADRDDHR